MKIALPVENDNKTTNLCISFGRTPFFMIYDVETKEMTFLDNGVAANAQGGAGIKAAQVVVDSKVTALLTPRCGENAAEVISAAKIAIYKTTGTSVMDNINAYVKGILPLLHEIHGGFHNHGGK